MRELFKHVKLVLGVILVILLVSLAVLGGYRLYKDHFILDYDPHLTQKEYQNTVLDQNVNLVFYKKKLSLLSGWEKRSCRCSQ